MADLTPAQIIERAFKVQGTGFKIRAENAVRELEKAGWKIVRDAK